MGAMIENLPEGTQTVPCARWKFDDTLKGGTMTARFLHLLEHFIGALLGGVGVGVLVGNVLVCLVLLVLGPAFAVEFFPR
jgi:hypothetical protein